jgi:hypothetical protein
VTPLKSNYRFTPATREYHDVSADQVSQNYIATPKTVTISGRVISGTIGMAGVTLAGLPDPPVTDDDGVYSVTVDYGWSGTITPTKTGYVFTPPSRQYDALASGQIDQNYIGALQTFKIAGRVTVDGAGLEAVALSGLKHPTTTDANGSYTGTVDYDWSGTVTPQRSGYVFDPPTRTYENVQSDQFGQSYAGRAALPDRPILLSPANGATDVKLTPMLEASVFTHPGGSDYYRRLWLVDDDPGFFSPVWSWSQPADAPAEIRIPAGTLSFETTYYWCVTCVSPEGPHSSSSSTWRFTTASKPSSSTKEEVEAPPAETPDNGEETPSEPNVGQLDQGSPQEAGIAPAAICPTTAAAMLTLTTLGLILSRQYPRRGRG